ncbi:hypothetical protein NPA08_03795 [Mycoplasmopsis citelli]|uniref:hypothetical protein n=1 Tax=Mycoplasmopsis citelli TaxID=171281 RepID=UPI002114B13B|nr:hypothetical protein [Mycoplasmopsis citelli]UUD36050.1 hypothetical protein NPA08_03795 [Mycoplasmopsis citelli]
MKLSKKKHNKMNKHLLYLFSIHILIILAQFTNSVVFIIIDIKNISYGFKQLGFKSALSNFIKANYKSFTLFSIVNDSVQLGFSIKELINLNNQIRQINKAEEEINHSIERISNQIQKYKKYGWTVINETE